MLVVLQVVDFYSLFGATSQVEGLLKMLLSLKPDLKALEDGEQQHLTADLALLLKGGGGAGGVPDVTELERIRIKSLSFAVALMTSDNFKHASAKVKCLWAIQRVFML